jgi:acyl-CoA dehydrogenase
MMNEARLSVALQGYTQGEVAYQNALAFARDRLQGRDVLGAQAPDKPADPIIVHPDVRRGLMDQKSLVEGGRALVFWGAELIDRSHRMNDDKAEAMISLLIPVMKGFLTDKGFEACVLAQQTLGGSGFTKEWGIEQFVRDARIAMIYEGTNGIQSLDLVGRKLPMNGGQTMMAFFEMVKSFIKENEENPDLKSGFLDPLKAASKDLQSAAMYFMQEGVKNPLNALSGSYDFMHLFGHVAVGFMWARMARAAMDALEAGASDTEFYKTKIATGRYYMARQLPATGMHLARITSGAEPVMALDAANF